MSFEIKQIKARKVSEFGEKFTAVADINIADGQPHLEGGLSVEGKITFSDYKAFKQLLLHLGHSDFASRRSKDKTFKNKVTKL